MGKLGLVASCGSDPALPVRVRSRSGYGWPLMCHGEGYVSGIVLCRIGHIELLLNATVV